MKLPQINWILIIEKLFSVLKVLEPTKEFQNNEIVKFVAGLPTGIGVRCILENVSDEELTRLRFQV